MKRNSSGRAPCVAAPPSSLSSEATFPLRAPSESAHDDLEPWIRGAAAGDRQAMRCLYEACVDRVYRLTVRMVGRQEADDLTQQVFLQAFAKLDQFRGGARFETWLYRLAVNESLQHLRREKRRQTQTLAVDPAQHLPDRLLESEQAALVQQALERIDPELRAILMLKEEERLSYREIAAAVEIPEGTVGSRLNRARRELRQELEKLGWG